LRVEPKKRGYLVRPACTAYAVIACGLGARCVHNVCRAIPFTIGPLREPT
jgi:hypothetical protein